MKTLGCETVFLEIYELNHVFLNWHMALFILPSETQLKLLISPERFRKK